MRLLGAGIVGALLVGMVLGVLAFRPGEGSTGVYHPVGYVREVERLIRDGKLEYLCESDEIRVTDLSPAEETFFDHSYLSDDVDAWNDGDRRPFFVEREPLRDGGCEGWIVGANASYHNQRLPGYVAQTWEGSLFLRPAAGATTLSSAERTLEVAPVHWRLLEGMDASAYEDAWFRGPRRDESVRSQRLALKMLEAGRPFATLKYVGDQAVLESEGTRPAVALNGCPVELGWRLRLDGGETLRIHEPGRLDQRFSVESGDRAGLVSFLTRVNGEPQRKSFPDRLPAAGDVARAVDAVVSAAREEGVAEARDDFDVHLTLDPFLGGRLGAGLAGFARSPDRYGDRPLRAAVTVMDAATGRLLALASYPRPGDLGDLDLDDGDTTRRELLRRNHNFLLHPVGSAAKPFLTATALAAEPRLAGLRLPCHPGGDPLEALLGYEMGRYRLPADCSGADQDGWIDLESFLTVSSNRYMLYLGLLSMADWTPDAPLPVRGAPPLPPDERYRIGDRLLSQKPSLPFVREDQAPGDGLTELQEVEEHGAFPRSFRQLFDQRVRFRKERMAEAFDLGPWEPVLRAAYGRETDGGSPPRPDAVASFSTVTPEHVNLRLNLAHQLRQNLYTLLLGNGDNRWSNVQLAEALARLVTGRAVEARLVERVVVPAERSEDGEERELWNLDDAPEAPSQGGLLDARLRRRILDGMRGVVERAEGTASDIGEKLAAINDRAPAGVTYSLLAKTGTPTLPPGVVRNGPTEIGPGALVTYYEGAEPQVESAALVLALRREAAGETQDVALTFFIEAQGGSRQAVELALALLEPLIETRWPEDWLTAEMPDGL